MLGTAWGAADTMGKAERTIKAFTSKAVSDTGMKKARQCDTRECAGDQEDII